MEQRGKETNKHENGKQYNPNFCFPELGKAELLCIYPDGYEIVETVDMSVRKDVHGLTFQDGELYVVAGDRIEEEDEEEEEEEENEALGTGPVDQMIPITELVQNDECSELQVLRTVIGGSHGRQMHIFTHRAEEITGAYLFTTEGDEETAPAIVVETGMEQIETRDGGGKMPITHAIPTNHIEELTFSN